MPSFTAVVATLLASSSPSSNTAVITGLYRHAVKGLSADSLDSVHIKHAYDTFPDDRRFALLYDKNADKFQELTPEWLHKDNFLCAFTNAELMAQYEAAYQMIQPREEETYALPCDTTASSQEAAPTTRRLLSLRNRKTNQVVWGPQDLATAQGREGLGHFFSQQSGRRQSVQCVTANKQQRHKHQFGNTSSGWKQRNKDTRTIHLINANTVRQVAQKCGLSHLHPTRFRPNIVVEGWEPWAEFDWIGKTLQIGDSIKLSILAKTVRCDGVSVDLLDYHVLDIPKVLTQHFPEHGPYLGVYAVIEDSGVISLGDQVVCLDSS